jgi:hypothetical protein
MDLWAFLTNAAPQPARLQFLVVSGGLCDEFLGVFGGSGDGVDFVDHVTTDSTMIANTERRGEKQG